jgi:long-chain acyl-CoA synthetase
VVQPVGPPDPALAAEIIAYCREHLAHLKCPRSVDVVDALPRSDAGKIQLPVLRARYAQINVGSVPGRSRRCPSS